jgi:NDP-sugar pyrophosphorylase family protein
MRAMIFAAGLGKRLGKITESIPKALVKVNGKTALHLAVEKCSLHGFGEIIINVHHFADMVESEADRLNKMGFSVSVSDERELLLETGGGLYKARKFFNNEPFLVYNSDIITDLDLSELYRFHNTKKGLVTLAVRKRQGNRFYLADKEGILNGWCNTATGEEIIARTGTDDLHQTAFSGVQVVDPSIFSYMNEGIYSLTTFYLRLAADHNIFTFNHDKGYWYDIGTPENLEKVRTFLK